MEEYETIIVGGGPAGLIAGRYLKNAVILEQKSEIGCPVQCGEGISTNALKMQNIAPNPAWICAKVHKIERIMPNGKAIGRWHNEEMGYIIDRVKFEQYLAKNTKCQLKLNIKITDLKNEKGSWVVFTKNGETFKSKYIIGADGFASVVRTKIFPENNKKIEFIPAIEYLIETEKPFDLNVMKMYFDNKNYKQGYAWIFPKSNNMANIGIIVSNSNIKEQLDNFLNNIIKKKFGNFKILENKSGTIPITKKPFALFKNNVLLTGDAAGLADPIFEGGMNQAMMSGKIAAQCILENKVKFYSKKMHKTPFLNPNIYKARKAFYLLDNKTLNELAKVLNDQGFSYLKTRDGVFKILSNLNIIKNLFNLFIFVHVWGKNNQYLW